MSRPKSTPDQREETRALCALLITGKQLADSIRDVLDQLTPSDRVFVQGNLRAFDDSWDRYGKASVRQRATRKVAA